LKFNIIITPIKYTSGAHGGFEQKYIAR